MKKVVALALAIPVVASVAAAAPRAPTPVTLTTRGPVSALAADGNRAALIVSKRGGIPEILVWEPIHRRVAHFHPLVVNNDCGRFCGMGDVALAGTRVGWLETAGGMTFEIRMVSATLGRRTPVELAEGDMPDDYAGTEALGPVGDGRVLAFTLQEICGDPESGGNPPCPPGRKPEDVIAASVWRVSRRGRCPAVVDYPAGHCTRVAQANGELTVLAVDAGRIAARTDHGVRLLTDRGGRLRDFPSTKASDAALSGNRLAVRVAGAVEIYDTGSGQLISSLPAPDSLKLEDLDSGILVTASGRAVTLRRLRDGRTTTIHAAGTASAQLERPGLFVSGGRRVSFTPMRDVLCRLGGCSS